MKLIKLSVAAAVVSAFAVPSFAGTVTGTSIVDIANLSAVVNAIAVYGTVPVTGAINVVSESGSVLDNEQTSTVTVTPSTVSSTGGTPTAVSPAEGTVTSPAGGTVTSPAGSDPNDASITGGSGNGAQGNVAINVTAGAGNAQGNEVALSAIDADRVFASAQTFSSQVSTPTLKGAAGSVNQAVVDGSLSGSLGNVSSNVAAGDGNLQDNQLSVSVNSSGTLAKATGLNIQTLGGVLDIGAGSLNAAYLSGGSLANAQGNIGSNITAGVGNAQHNSLSIAVATAPTGTSGLVGGLSSAALGR